MLTMRSLRFIVVDDVVVIVVVIVVCIIPTNYRLLLMDHG
jgi:hypothetical protein